MRLVRAAGVQLSPVLYGREGTVEKVVRTIHEQSASTNVTAEPVQHSASLRRRWHHDSAPPQDHAHLS